MFIGWGPLRFFVGPFENLPKLVPTPNVELSTFKAIFEAFTTGKWPDFETPSLNLG